MLSLYRALLRRRRSSAALSVGAFALAESDEDVLAFERRHGGERLLVALNLGGQERRLALPPDARILETTLATPAAGGLRPNEGLIVSLAENR